MSKVISVRVPENLRIALEAKTQAEDLSMGELVKRSLELSLRSDELELMETAHEKTSQQSKISQSFHQQKPHR